MDRHRIAFRCTLAILLILGALLATALAHAGTEDSVLPAGPRDGGTPVVESLQPPVPAGH